jgi:hypothetical protein
MLTKLFSIAGVAGLVVWASGASAADRLSDRQLEAVTAGAIPVTPTAGATFGPCPLCTLAIAIIKANWDGTSANEPNPEVLNNLLNAAVLAIRPGAMPATPPKP